MEEFTELGAQKKNEEKKRNERLKTECLKRSSSVKPEEERSEGHHDGEGAAEII